MRAYSRAMVGIAAGSWGLLSLTACGSSDEHAPTMTAGSSGAQVQVGNTINYGSFGTTADIDCGEGKSLNVGGSNNTLTVRGTCGSVNVGGADNKIALDGVADITVVGLNNTITYKTMSSNDGRHDLGSGNSIRKV